MPACYDEFMYVTHVCFHNIAAYGVFLHACIVSHSLHILVAHDEHHVIWDIYVTTRDRMVLYTCVSHGICPVGRHLCWHRGKNHMNHEAWGL